MSDLRQQPAPTAIESDHSSVRLYKTRVPRSNVWSEA